MQYQICEESYSMFPIFIVCLILPATYFRPDDFEFETPTFFWSKTLRQYITITFQNYRLENKLLGYGCYHVKS